VVFVAELSDQPIFSFGRGPRNEEWENADVVFDSLLLSSREAASLTARRA